eukprot:snap_masked-scaffold337_size202799-processed-gene-1.15 protein:Tk05312 transcript:snap_masked-scaffold337_size202799-processed-gene-1.15-mRNA-1 annotation:"tuftelin-interacting protein 11"
MLNGDYSTDSDHLDRAHAGSVTLSAVVRVNAVHWDRLKTSPVNAGTIHGRPHPPGRSHRFHRPPLSDVHRKPARIGQPGPMAHEDEVLAFEVTDQDLADEVHLGLGFGGRRGRASKNRTIYGVWADDSDEADAPELSRGGPAGRTGGRLPLTTPLSFVSAGQADASAPTTPTPADSSSEEEASAGRRGTRGRARGGIRRPAARLDPTHGQIAGLRNPDYHHRAPLGRGFGDWEKNTKGIGSKLLFQMGFEVGKGLGKHLQGRSQIVEAHLRRGRGAIGAYGREGGRPVQRVDSEEEEERQFREERGQWRKGATPAAARASRPPTQVYKSADQIVAEARGRPGARTGAEAGSLSQVKVIDMTGPEERVLSGYHAIATQSIPADDPAGLDRSDFALPELMHNVHLLVNTCEEDIIHADRQLRHHRNNVELLRAEEAKLSTLVERESRVIHTLEDVLSMVEKIEALHDEGRLDLDSARDLFLQMSLDHPDEYQAYGLAHIAVTVVGPLLKTEMAHWDVLAQPSRYRELLLVWQRLIGASSSLGSRQSHEADPFYHLVWETWMVRVRLAIGQWDVRNPDQLIDFLKTWTDVVHPQIMDHIRQSIVLPKLQISVEQWNPMTDPVPIHAWLHPWLELMRDGLDIVYPTIKFKLAAALTAWHPSDKSARLILLPWQGVFDPASLYAFLLKNIAPKLETALAGFVINPANQNMDVWEWVTDWDGLLPPVAMVGLLEKHFFSAWLKVLAQWLNHNPNYTEVTRWFEGWKAELANLKDVLKHQQAWTALQQALEMMVRAVSGGTPMSRQPGAMEAMQYLKTRELANVPTFRPSPPPSLPPPPPPPILSGGNGSAAGLPLPPTAPLGFKELVMRRCEENNITFVPRPGRAFQGKQLYQCGRNVIYLDNNVIFVQKKGTWVPASLIDLVESS